MAFFWPLIAKENELEKMKTQSPALIVCSITMLLVSGFSLIHRNKKLPLNKHVRKSSSFKVVIDKSSYELRVYDNEGWLYTYPVVFGTSDLTDKMMEGDRRTPEGHFRITGKKIHPEWGYFMLLDYPNQTDLQKFNERKRNGVIPSTAKPGGGIGIHATRRNEDRFVDYYYNWTLGCISTKREYARELYSLLPIGTEVTIQQ